MHRSKSNEEVGLSQAGRASGEARAAMEVEDETQSVATASAPEDRGTAHATPSPRPYVRRSVPPIPPVPPEVAAHSIEPVSSDSSVRLWNPQDERQDKMEKPGG